MASTTLLVSRPTAPLPIPHVGGEAPHRRSQPLITRLVSRHIDRSLRPTDQVEYGFCGEASVQAASAPRGALVLVVEDDEPLAELISGVLVGEGYRVATASDG